MKPLTRRILTAVVLLLPTVTLVLWAPAWLFLLGLLPIALYGLWEYLELAGRTGLAPLRLPVFVFGAALMASAWQWPDRTLLFILAAGVVIGVTELIHRPRLAEAVPASSAGFLGVVYVALPLALVIHLRAAGDGPRVVLAVLVLVWIADVAAFAVGKLMGRHKLIPSISPGKTMEGTVGSIILTVAAGYALLPYWLPSMDSIHAIAFPLFINVVAQLGDLAESALKRGAGVKDSSNLLPGHGGVLDRIDSLLFAIPAAWYYWGWFF